MQILTVKLAIDMYISDSKCRNLSPNTLDLMKYAFKSFGKSIDSEKNIIEINNISVRQYLFSVIENRSPSTAARYWEILRTFFKWCINEEFIETNPMGTIRKPRKNPIIINPLSAQDVEKMINSIGNDFVGIRNKLIISLLFDCGFRATELCSLNIEDIDLDNKTILIRHGKGNKPRLLPYGVFSSKLLMKYLVYRGDLASDSLIINAYGDPVDRHSIRQIIERISNKVGLKVTPHQLRHSCAVAMLRNGSDAFTVQKLLGHSTLLMTRHYSQLADSDLILKHSLYSPADRLNCISTEKKKRII